MNAVKDSKRRVIKFKNKPRKNPFPGDPFRCAEWSSIVANERQEENYIATKHSVICSLHFEERDILGHPERRRLSNAAVPKLQIQLQLNDANANITQTEQTAQSLEKYSKTLTRLNYRGNEKIQLVPPPIQLSVEVEVETCDTVNTICTIQNVCSPINPITNSSEQEVHYVNTIEVNEKYSDELPCNIEKKVYYIRKIIPEVKRKQENHTIVKQYTLTTETIMKAIEEQSKENTEESDKCLDTFCRNLHGHFRNITLSSYDDEVNRALKFWGDWHNLSPLFRSTPLMYKCYICYKGWWRLHPFREHLKEHSNLDLKLRSEPIQHEFNVIASTKLAVKVESIKMDSNCWKCGRDATFHKHSKLSSKYECSGCNKSMITCTRLKEHESMCIRNIKLTCKKYNVNASEGKTCTVCYMYCVNEQVLDAHMTDYHLVRSDEPVHVDARACMHCGGRYLFFKFHDCPAKSRPYECDVCYKSFPSLIFRQIHTELSKNHVVSCTVCGVVLSQCLAPRHYLKHSKNYCLLYMCRKCDNEVLFTNEAMCLNHVKTHNKKVPIGRMLLPLKCFNGEIVKCETTFSVPDEILVNFMTGFEVFFSPNDMETTSQRKETQAHTLTTPNKATDDVDGDVIFLDDKDDVELSMESAQNSENLVEKAFDISAMQAQLDEEIMKDLEVEADLCKLIQSSKSYRLLMEKESSEERCKENESMNKEFKTKDIMEKGSIKNGSLDKGTTTEFKSEESIKNELMEAEENEDIYEDDLILLDNGVEDITTISDSDCENTSERSTHTNIKCEKKELDNIEDVKIGFDNDIKKEKYLNPDDEKEYPNNANEDLDWDSSTYIKEETNENTIEMESEVLSHKIKLEPPEDLTEVYEDIPQIINSQSIKTDVDAVDMESGVQLYKCKVCDYRGEWSEYIVHVSTECRGTEFRCNLCARRLSLSNYLEHLTEHGFKPLTCPECFNQKKSLDELQTHVTSHILTLFATSPATQDNSLHYCKKCGNCVQFEYFFKHWQAHVNSLFYPDEDNTSESSIGSNQDGLEIVSPELITEMLDILRRKNKRGQLKQCIVCFKIIERWNELKRHLIEHLLSQAINIRRMKKRKTISCFFCVKRYPKVNEWKYHMREHSFLNVYKCPLCTKRFNDSSNFCKHKKVHNIFTFICALCGGKYSTKRYLIQHLQLHENSLSCEKCDRTFINESRLKKHIIHKHNTNGVHRRPFPCSMCTKRFQSWKDKQQHLWIKHGHRKVVADCPICNMGFRTAANVKKHMRLEHNTTDKITFVKEGESIQIRVTQERE